jgi:hypothetical protein
VAGFMVFTEIDHAAVAKQFGRRGQAAAGNLPAATQPTEQVMRALLSVSLLVLTALPALAAERWETLPPTPAPIATDRRGEAQVNGISIHYRIYG